jgi:carbamoyl-phosphate synthase large subunit
MTDSIGVLFLGGAKRVSMARKFKAAGARMGCEVRIYSYEMTTEVPIALEGTVIVGKRWRDADLYEHLHEVCAANNISVLVPFVDAAVGVAAEYVQRYPGEAFAPTGTRDRAELMFDKVAAAAEFERLGLPIPKTYHAGDPCLRLIAKPRHGSASQGIRTINSIDQLDDVLAHSADYLIQERIDNRRELTVDCYVSTHSGHITAVVPRVRDEVSGGEVSRTTVLHYPEAEALVRRTLQATGLRGAVTVQLINDLDDGRLMIMEINPRLGGGAVAAVHAGADLPAMILSEATGREPEACTDHADITVARYLDEAVFTK